MMLSQAIRLARMAALAGCAAFIMACESVPASKLLDDVVNKDLVGKVSAGIKPIENRLLAEQTMEVLVYLNNGTDSPIEVLPWGTPLEQSLTADVFVITRDGESVSYGGRIVKRAAPGPDDYLTLAAGERRETVVDISESYFVGEAGEYTIKLKTSEFTGKAATLIQSLIVDDVVVITRQ